MSDGEIASAIIFLLLLGYSFVGGWLLSRSYAIKNIIGRNVGCPECNELGERVSYRFARCYNPACDTEKFRVVRQK